jgi:hypothetical protein
MQEKEPRGRDSQQACPATDYSVLIALTVYLAGPHALTVELVVGGLQTQLEVL